MSSYLPYLPAVFRQSAFLGRFLRAFEAVISGVDEASLPDDPKLAPYRSLKGLEQILDGVDRAFDPWTTEKDFLPWLAQWVATSLREDWSPETRRRFIAKIVPLYRQRGTRAGIEGVLRLSGDEALVVDFNDGLHQDLEVAHFSNTPKPAHFFGVILTVNERDPVKLARQARRVRAIVDREKPAHTFYGLRIMYPAMRINNDPKKNTDFGPGMTISNTNPLVLGTKKA